MTESREYLIFEWSDEFEAWVITVDGDARLYIDEIIEVVGKQPFLVRIHPEKVN